MGPLDLQGGAAGETRRSKEHPVPNFKILKKGRNFQPKKKNLLVRKKKSSNNQKRILEQWFCS